MNGIFVYCMLIINGYCAIGRFLIICIYGKKNMLNLEWSWEQMA